MENKPLSHSRTAGTRGVEDRMLIITCTLLRSECFRRVLPSAAAGLGSVAVDALSGTVHVHGMSFRGSGRATDKVSEVLRQVLCSSFDLSLVMIAGYSSALSRGKSLQGGRGTLIVIIGFQRDRGRRCKEVSPIMKLDWQWWKGQQ